MAKARLWLWGPVILLLIAGCAPRPSSPTVPPTVPPAAGEGGVTMELKSSAFGYGQPIPTRYTCDGEDISPPLEWTDPPAGTRSFALIMDDPDAPVGVWDHWVLFNIPPETRFLPEGVPPDPDLAQGGRHGRNSWKRLGYGGPCPPGGTHRYFFRLYALDTVLDLSSGATRKDVLRAMGGHILAQAELMGTYRR